MVIGLSYRERCILSESRHLRWRDDAKRDDIFTMVSINECTLVFPRRGKRYRHNVIIN